MFPGRRVICDRLGEEDGVGIRNENTVVVVVDIFAVHDGNVPTTPVVPPVRVKRSETCRRADYDARSYRARTPKKRARRFSSETNRRKTRGRAARFCVLLHVYDAEYNNIVVLLLLLLHKCPGAVARGPKSTLRDDREGSV